MPWMPRLSQVVDVEGCRSAAGFGRVRQEALVGGIDLSLRRKLGSEQSPDLVGGIDLPLRRKLGLGQIQPIPCGSLT